MKQFLKFLFIGLAAAGLMVSCDKGGNEGGNGGGGKKAIVASFPLPEEVTFTTDDYLAGASDEIKVVLAEVSDLVFLCDLKVDETLVAAYNTEHNTTYELLPETCYNLSGKTLMAAAGKTETNAATVTLTGSTVGIEAGKTYILPLNASLDESVESEFTLENLPHYVIFNCDYLNLDPVGINVRNLKGVTATIDGGTVVDMGDNTHTIEFRFYANEWHEDGEVTYMGAWRGKDKNNNNENFSGMEFRYHGSRGSSGIGGRQCDITNETSKHVITTGEWHTLSVTCDGTKTGQNTEVAYVMYLDGEKVAEAKPTKRWGAQSSQKFQVGYTLTGFQFGNSNAKFYYDGLISEIRMWKTVRTQDEIKATLKTVANPSADEMYAYWKLDEGEGYQLKDSSGNGHHMTMPSTDSSGDAVANFWDSKPEASAE